MHGLPQAVSPCWTLLHATHPFVADDPVLTHQQLAAQARAEAARFRKAAEKALKEAEWWEKVAAMADADVGEAIERLTLMTGDDNTVNTVNATATTASLRSKGRLTKSARRHPFVAALAKRNETVLDAKKALDTKLGRDVGRSTVQAWYKPTTNAAYRPIPRDAAEAIAALYGVPLSTWPRITD